MFVLLSFILSALVPFVLYQYYFIFKEDSSISCSTVLVMWDRDDLYTVTERKFMNLDIHGWLTKDNRLISESSKSIWVLIFGWVVLLCLLPTIFQLYKCIVAVSFIGGENRSAQRRPWTCRKSLTNVITY